MSVIYRQYDSRWGKLSYPSGNTMAGSGCGPTACANVIANKSNSSVTPKNTRKFMLKGNYAVKNAGTKWSGIPACLKHWGYSVKECATMKDVWKECEAGHKQGVILFAPGTKGGITWTSGGHYVAFTDYKKSNGKHYLYTRDSGSRKHDGWYCYETTMKGLIPIIWTCYHPKKTSKPTTSKTKKAYTGEFPTTTVKKGSSGTNVKRVQKFFNWLAGKTVLTVDGICGDKTVAQIKTFQKKYGLVQDGICGPKTIAKMKTIKKIK